MGKPVGKHSTTTGFHKASKATVAILGVGQTSFATHKMCRAERQSIKRDRIHKNKNEHFCNKGKKFVAAERKEEWQEVKPIGQLADRVVARPRKALRPTFADLEPFLRGAPLDVLEQLAMVAEVGPDGVTLAALPDIVVPEHRSAFVPGDGAAYDPTSPEAKRGRERRRELVSAMKKAMPKHGLVSRRQAAWLEAAWVPSDDVLRCLLFDWKCAAPGGAELRFLRREVVLGGGQAPVAVARTVRVIEGSGRAVCQLTLEPEEGAAEGAVVTLVLERSFAGTMRLVGQCARSGAPVVAIEAHLLS
jgi:hypothetical protein